MKPVTAWAAVDPKGKIRAGTVRAVRDEAEIEAEWEASDKSGLGVPLFSELKQLGWRIARVQITEVEK